MRNLPFRSAKEQRGPLRIRNQTNSIGRILTIEVTEAIITAIHSRRTLIPTEPPAASKNNKKRLQRNAMA
jgi:hypothetical protein